MLPVGSGKWRARTILHLDPDRDDEFTNHELDQNPVSYIHRFDWGQLFVGDFFYNPAMFLSD